MINIESLTTAYDLPITLVEWLKKVENLVTNTALTNIEIVAVEDGYKLVLTFNDGTTQESNTFKLPPFKSFDAVKIATPITIKYGKMTINNNIATIFVNAEISQTSTLSFGTPLFEIPLPQDIIDKIPLLRGLTVFSHEHVSARYGDATSEQADLYIDCAVNETSLVFSNSNNIGSTTRVYDFNFTKDIILYEQQQ